MANYVCGKGGLFCRQDQVTKLPGRRFKDAYELLDIRALKISMLCEVYIF